MSLERKLPLIVIAVLIATLASAVGLAYREVRRAGEVEAAARTQALARQLASLLVASVTPRAQLLHQVARSAAIGEAARRASIGSSGSTGGQQPGPATANRKSTAPAEAAARGAAASALRSLASPRDTALVIELWSAKGELLDSIGGPPVTASTTNDSARTVAVPGARIAATTMPDGDSVHFLPFFEGKDHRVYYWITVPVVDHGARVGWVAEQARIQSRPGTKRQIDMLLGKNTAAYFRNTNDPFWTTLGGVPASNPAAASLLPTPVNFKLPVTTSYTRMPHGSVLATALPVDGTPWWVVVEIDDSAVLAGARALLFKFSALTLPLLIAAAAISWLLIRRALRPLVDLTDAATLIAHGDYSARVAVSHDDEVGRLGESFNKMAADVDASHARLAGQVHEARRLAEERDEARGIAVSASQAKSNFLATMSHEIRTPINAIIGYADILDLGITGPLTPKQHENVQRIRTSSSHLLALVNDVLDLSRIESGAMQLKRTQIETRPSIDAALSLVEPMARAKQIPITVKSDDTRASTFTGDERGVRQALANLLSNAVKFTEPGGEILITTSLSSAVSASEVLEHGRTYVAIHVYDTGIGIDINQISRLFQPFTQLEAENGSPYTRQRSGAGLGLSISRHLARMMGGDITVESVPRRGSTFTLWLPQTA
ncbi:MAG: ATP-binding protein [Gemmatimonadaceae bacterium]